MTEKNLLPPIYPITDIRLSGLSHAEQVRRLMAGGASLIQLREKCLSPKDFFEDAREALEIARSNGVRIIINDRVDIALALDADGVHIGQTDLAPSNAKTLLGPDKIVGFSTHSVTQAIEAMKLEVDYIAIGPVFETATKVDTDPVVGPQGVIEVRAAIGDLPLIGIGGIKSENLAEVFNAGADSVALISEILASSRGITDAYKQLAHLAETRSAN